MLGAHDLDEQLAQVRLGQRGGTAAGGRHGLLRGARAQGQLQPLARMAGLHMADLVADDVADLVVGHQVHQAAEEADRSVGQREGVDVTRQVDLVVQCQAAVVAAARGQRVQAPGLRALRRRHRGPGVHLLGHAAAVGPDVVVAQPRGAGGALRGAQRLGQVEGLGLECQRGGGQRQQGVASGRHRCLRSGWLSVTAVSIAPVSRVFQPGPRKVSVVAAAVVAALTSAARSPASPPAAGCPSAPPGPARVPGRASGSAPPAAPRPNGSPSRA